jgi:hypothetical protein
MLHDEPGKAKMLPKRCDGLDFPHNGSDMRYLHSALRGRNFIGRSYDSKYEFAIGFGIEKRKSHRSGTVVKCNLLQHTYSEALQAVDFMVYLCSAWNRVNDGEDAVAMAGEKVRKCVTLSLGRLQHIYCHTSKLTGYIFRVDSDRPVAIPAI